MVRLPGEDENWKGSYTLGETILRLVRAKQAQSHEFQSLVSFYGRDKVISLYKEELEKESALVSQNQQKETTQ